MKKIGYAIAAALGLGALGVGYGLLEWIYIMIHGLF